MINRAIAAGVTAGFLALVRPDTGVTLWGVGITAILMYEGTLYVVNGIRNHQRKKKEEKYTTVSLSDIKRWADTDLHHPLEEVAS
jgi:Sec-independent protein secretion pathway component TatC